MTVEAVSKQKEIHRPIYAVGLFIVDIDTGLIWCIKELSSSLKTMKTAGQISIPLETKKVNETSIGTAIGGLEEFKTLQEGESLIFIGGNVSSKGRYKYANGNFVDFMILGYSKGTGSNSDDNKIVDKQVESMGWRSIEDLIDEENLRTGLLPFLDLAVREDWIGNFRSNIDNDQITKVVIKKGDYRLGHISDRNRMKDFNKTK